ALVKTLRSRLEPYGLADCVALCSRTSKPLPKGAEKICPGLDAACEADLLLNLGYVITPTVLRRFRRSVLVDVDPGLTQVWMATGGKRVPPHVVYFPPGGTGGPPGSLVPDFGIRWAFPPPAVFLPPWPTTVAGSEASFPTVANWYGGEWVEFA